MMPPPGLTLTTGITSVAELLGAERASRTLAWEISYAMMPPTMGPARVGMIQSSDPAAKPMIKPRPKPLRPPIDVPASVVRNAPHHSTGRPSP